MVLSAHLEPVGDVAALGARWRALEERCGGAPSFFLRWLWMESWLSTCVAGQAPMPDVLAVERDGHDVALALVGRGAARRALGAVSALWLNQSGDAAADRPFIEYNGLLAGAQDAGEAARAAMACLARERGWRLLFLSGMAGDAPLLAHLPPARRVVRRDVSPAYFVDLAAVRAGGGEYLALLSGNTRSQIRRSLKELGGEIAVEQALDAATVAGWLEDARALNAGRHADNAWEAEGFRAFLRAITLAGMADGSVELLRFCCNGEVLGYLHNFRHGERAMNYQSAFAAPLSSKSKPGLMCHAAAVTRYAAQGLAHYSLLAGKDRYKQSLSTGTEELEWLALERFSPALEAEALLRRLLRR